VANTPRSRRLFLLAAVAVLALLAIGVAVGFTTGYLQVRPPVPGYEVRRDEGVEGLFVGREAAFAFRFRGGVPKCWAQVDRPTGPETFLLDAKPAAVQGSAPRSPPDEVEGLIALVAPAKPEDTYTLHLVVSKLTYPEGRRPIGAATNPAAYSTGPKPDAPKLTGAAGSGRGALALLQSPELQAGQDFELVDGTVGPRSGPGVRVRLWVRFYTPDELATAEAQPGGGR
jgi:hypothetical protein